MCKTCWPSRNNWLCEVVFFVHPSIRHRTLRAIKISSLTGVEQTDQKDFSGLKESCDITYTQIWPQGVERLRQFTPMWYVVCGSNNDNHHYRWNWTLVDLYHFEDLGSPWIWNNNTVYTTEFEGVGRNLQRMLVLSRDQVTLGDSPGWCLVCVVTLTIASQDTLIPPLATTLGNFLHNHRKR